MASKPMTFRQQRDLRRRINQALATAGATFGSYQRYIRSSQANQFDWRLAALFQEFLGTHDSTTSTIVDHPWYGHSWTVPPLEVQVQKLVKLYPTLRWPYYPLPSGDPPIAAPFEGRVILPKHDFLAEAMGINECLTDAGYNDLFWEAACRMTDANCLHYLPSGMTVRLCPEGVAFVRDLEARYPHSDWMIIDVSLGRLFGGYQRDSVFIAAQAQGYSVLSTVHAMCLNTLIPERMGHERHFYVISSPLEEYFSDDGDTGTVHLGYSAHNTVRISYEPYGDATRSHRVFVPPIAKLKTLL